MPRNIWPIAALLAFAAHAQAQAPQERRDARYPNPSGQDSNPGKTEVKPTKPAPRSANPEDAHSATKGAAAEQTYQAGKKADASAGCSTPTDAQSAGAAGGDTRGGVHKDGTRTVCTTTGADPATQRSRSADASGKRSSEPRSPEASDKRSPEAPEKRSSSAPAKPRG
jgi:hypothetical protein